MQLTTIWTSNLIQQTLEKVRMGIYTDIECFYKRDIELKAANILFRLSAEEQKEFNKCSNNIVYFVEKHCRFLTDYGRILVNLRDFQRDILDTLGEQIFIEDLQDFGPKVRNYILMASRQIGKTTTIAAYFAWYMCFNTDRNLAVLANKQTTAVEIVSKITDIFKGLPFFLKPGILHIGGLGMRLDNGCQLLSQATTATAQIGFTIHVLYADEFAHIHNNIVRPFWKSVYPTLSSSLVSQCIISSTPEGVNNLFYEIWDRANTGENDFVFKRVDYWEVPEHDDEWADKIRRNFGEEYFAQEFELQFTVDSKLLLSGNDFAFLKKIENKYEYIELEKTKLDEELCRNLKWKPGFDPNEDFNPKEYRFVLSVDIAEGKDEDEVKDNDYNVISIFKAEIKSLASLKKLRKDEYYLKNMIRLNQVGIYRDNIKDDDIAAKVAQAIIFDQFYGVPCLLLIEMNFNGKNFLNIFSRHDEYYDDIVLRTYHTKAIPGEKPPKRKPGFKVSSDKNYFCKLGRRLIRERTLIPNESTTISEFTSFGKDKRGSWKGHAAHDDTVMAVLNISRLYNEIFYDDTLHDFLEEFRDCNQKRLMSKFIKELETPSDIGDEMFEALFNTDAIISSEETTNLNKIFKEGEERKLRYSLGSTFRNKI